jgi:uncharacterized repeat protein (TIGR03803 family)
MAHYLLPIATRKTCQTSEDSYHACMWTKKSLWVFASFLLTASIVRGGIIFTSLYSFNGTNGGNSSAALILGKDGFLYGTAQYGGSNRTDTFTGEGTVFKITTNGAFTPLVYFTGANGRNPRAGLVQTTNGLLYGTTYQNGGGSVFRMTTNGSLTNIVWFNSSGSDPAAKPTISTDGYLYGTLASSGAYSKGAIFRTTTNGANIILASFNGSNGRIPQSPLVQATDGNFYGTAGSGGLNDLGTVYRVTPTGTISNLFSFLGANGANPYAGLVQASDGFLYGTTSSGGAFSCGTVFRIDTNGVLNILVSFNGTNGVSPFNGLIQGNDGCFYGVTTYGGTGFSGGWTGKGTIFKMTTNGILTTLLLFNGTNGQWPAGELIQGSDGVFYGTTESGGINTISWGTIFKFSVPPPPTFQSVAQMNGSLILAWQAVAGQNYQVQYNSNLNTTNWNNFGNAFTASSNVITTTDNNLSGNSRFYRILMLP